MTPQESTRERLKEEFHLFSLAMAQGYENGTFDYRNTERAISDWWLDKLESECTLREERGREEVKKEVEEFMDCFKDFRIEDQGESVRFADDWYRPRQVKQAIEDYRKSLLPHPEGLEDKDK